MTAKDEVDRIKEEDDSYWFSDQSNYIHASVEGIAERILTRVGTEVPMYLSVDVGVLDVAFAPGTGTPEAVGWSTRELIRMIARD
ncbi:hypothetical protein D6D13_00563 [Aureobasidium pullulans]|uniref:Arginase n=1 Tax=Aureobasidium pullulans TaxID=5580 RepID=A0A4S9DC13_AURPU|nr:hypothetical protein D6D13_00563 [Aureobasidium pullulans]